MQWAEPVPGGTSHQGRSRGRTVQEAMTAGTTGPLLNQRALAVMAERTAAAPTSHKGNSGHGWGGGALAWSGRGSGRLRSCAGAPGGTRVRRGYLSDKENETPMAATLQEILLAPDTWPQVVADCQQLIAQEVSAKSGVSGTAVKLAYKTAKTFASGYFQATVENLLPDMVAELRAVLGGSRSLWCLRVRRLPGQARRGGVGGPAVGDRCAAETAQRPTILKAYRAVRGGAARHVVAALPNVGSLVQKYAA